MPAAAGCSNCCTKYTIFNRELGCPMCHLSFCKKCLSRKARLPGGKPTEEVSVCSRCFDKLKQVAPPRPSLPACAVDHGLYPSLYSAASSNSNPRSLSSANADAPNSGQHWWGSGLPPPSMRAPSHPQLWREVQIRGPNCSNDTSDLERKLNSVRGIEGPSSSQQSDKILTLSEIEDRLAALRGCDVELVRNPRAWFESKADEPLESDTVEGLLRMAQDKVRIEGIVDDEIEQRYKRIKECATAEDKTVCARNEQGNANRPENRISAVSSTASCLSNVSVDTAFSETTKEELRQINELMSDAERRIKNARPTNEELNTEMKQVLAETRQKSVDIDKINNEIGSFYKTRIDNEELDDDGSISTASMDETTFRQIVEEAERADEDNTRNEVVEDVWTEGGMGGGGGSNNTPRSGHSSFSVEAPTKAKSFLGRFFKK